jgi:hypothetical protein
MKHLLETKEIVYVCKIFIFSILLCYYYYYYYYYHIKQLLIP